MANRFHPISLKFNEASCETVANWTFDGIFKNTTKVKTRYKRALGHYERAPILKSFFHRCSLCSLWGHSEVECTQIMDSCHLVEVVREIKMAHRFHFENDPGKVIGSEGKASKGFFF